MRKLTDLIVAMTAGLCACVSVAILSGLVYVVAQRGIPALSWSFFTEQIRLVGAAGGIFWNLIGTTILLAAAAFGPDGPQGAHMIALGDGLRALKRVGLDAEARRLAFEALYTHWPRRGKA